MSKQEIYHPNDPDRIPMPRLRPELPEDAPMSPQDRALAAFLTERFSIQPAVITAFRQAAAAASKRLLQAIVDDRKFMAMKPRDQLKFMEMAMDRAYGKVETETNRATIEAKLGASSQQTSDHAAQLRAIEARARSASPAQRRHLSHEGVPFAERSNSTRADAEKVVRLRPPTDEA